MISGISSRLNLASISGAASDARDTSTEQGLPNASGAYVTVDYRVQEKVRSGPLRSGCATLTIPSIRVQVTFNEFRFVVNDPLPIL